MENKKGFQRTFLIFNVEDNGYDSGQKASGYVRIEIREGRGKLWASVQNLNTMDGKLRYKLYLLKTANGKINAICPGILNINQNRGVLEWEFVSENVHNSDFNIDETEVAAVLAEYCDRENTSLRCPLAAYRGKKIEWRKALEKSIYRQYTIPYQGMANSSISKSDAQVESKHLPALPFFEENTPQHQETGNLDIEKHTHENINEHSDKHDNESINEQADENESFDMGHQQNNDNINPQAEYPVNSNYAQEASVNLQNQAGITNPDNKCLYMHGNLCAMYLNTAGINPCTSCTIHSQTQRIDHTVVKSADVSKLGDLLESNFESSDPFNSRRTDYRWWKVSNPVNLNNILYQCSIRSPLLFNPMVMMAHFKYRHLIIGIFSDRVKGLEYVVCGVPGMHMVDKRPFGDLCRWVQVEAGKPKYGGFGYWIVYIEPETGKILNLR